MTQRTFAAALVLGSIIAGLTVGTAHASNRARLSEAPARSVISAPTISTYTVHGQTVVLKCAGSGKIPVVFLAGGDDPSTVWNGIVTKLGPNVLSCLFDRPGVGGSTPSPVPLTPRSVGKTLNATLNQAQIGKHFILVGHSIGGANVLVFGAKYPSKVAGAVLIDPSQAKFFEVTHADSVLAGYGYAAPATKSQIRAVKHWPNVPLVVLSRDPKKAIADQQATASQEAVWVAGARKYARLSSKGSRLVVPNATHYVYIDAPDVTTTAINEVLSEAR
jgi:hypothetical protein